MNQIKNLNQTFFKKIWVFLSDRDNKKKNAVIFNIIILIISCSFSLFMVFRHECFRDEAQAWLIARDVPFSDFFTELKYEMHPMLWFLVLMPFARLGFPYITLNIISWLFTAASLFMLMFKLKFNKILKLLIAFSPFFLYWYPAISRDYVLSVFLMFLLMCFYPERHEKPIRYALAAAALFSTHIIMLGVGLAVIAVEIGEIIYDKAKENAVSIRRLIALGIESIGGLFLYLQLSGGTQLNKDVGHQTEPMAFFDYLLTELYDIMSDFFGMDTPTKFFSYYGDGKFDYKIVLSSLLLFCFILFFILLLKKPRQLVFYVLGAGCIIGMQVTVYFSNAQRTGLLYLLFLFIISSFEYDKLYSPKQRKDGKKDIEINYKSVLSVFISISCLIAIIISPSTYFIGDINGNFSGSKAIAEYIDENVPEDVPVIGFWDSTASGVMAYSKTNHLYYSCFFHRPFSYVIWNEDWQKGSSEYRAPLNDEYTFIKYCEKSNKEYDTSNVKVLDKFYELIQKDFQKNDKVMVVFSGSVSKIFAYDTSINKDKFILKKRAASYYDREETLSIYELTI